MLVAPLDHTVTRIVAALALRTVLIDWGLADGARPFEYLLTSAIHY